MSPCGDGCDWGLRGTQQLVGAAWCGSQMTCGSLFPHNTQEAIYGGNMRLLLNFIRETFKSTQTFLWAQVSSGTNAPVLKLLNDFDTSFKKLLFWTSWGSHYGHPGRQPFLFRTHWLKCHSLSITLMLISESMLIGQIFCFLMSALASSEYSLQKSGTDTTVDTTYAGRSSLYGLFYTWYVLHQYLKTLSTQSRYARVCTYIHAYI